MANRSVDDKFYRGGEECGYTKDSRREDVGFIGLFCILIVVLVTQIYTPVKSHRNLPPEKVNIYCMKIFKINFKAAYT